MKLIYGIKDKPKFGKLIVFAFQQLLAIMAATIAVPMITSGVYNCGEVQMSTVAALFGAGAGTLVYVLFTKAKSPVFLGSSFAFLGSMAAAFAGATTVALGYLGLILGAVFAGLVYVVIAIAEQSRIVRLPLNQVGSLNKVNQEINKFEQENQRRPSVEELAARTGVDDERNFQRHYLSYIGDVCRVRSCIMHRWYFRLLLP